MMTFCSLFTRCRFLPGPLLALALTIFPVAAAQAGGEIIRSHAIAMHGKAKYGPDFERFDYTSAKARKGGRVKLSAIGTFDSLNPFIPKGTPASGLGLIYDTLTTRSYDEPFTEYGLLAEQLEYPEDRSWIIYHLNPKARFHDGEPVTADDVVFTLKLLREQGNPFYRYYYANIKSVEALAPHKVKFTFDGKDNRELALITGQLQILPKHYWEKRDFAKASLEPPLGSGPYRIKSMEPGRSLTLERDPNYWARNLPVNRGIYNYDEIRYDYYRDQNVEFEAFKAGEFDFRVETSAKTWATGYNFDAVKQGRLKKVQIKHNNPTGMQGYQFNLRRPLFQDRALREAIGYAFDFEWSNKNLFYGQYSRTLSFFSNSDLASSGLPEGEELAVLERFRDQLPPEIFTQPFTLPTTEGNGKNRKNLRSAKKLLERAGYNIKNNQLYPPGGENPVEFEILLVSPAFERITNPFVKNLHRLGIKAQVRIVDASQYINRLRNFDFDMIVRTIAQSTSPGNEQRDFWHSSAADSEGSRNIGGLKDPVIDQLVDLVISAPSRESLVARTRALDRVLLNKHIVVPQWHSKYHRLAYWDKFQQPAISTTYDPGFGMGFFTWWIDDSKQGRLQGQNR